MAKSTVSGAGFDMLENRERAEAHAQSVRVLPPTIPVSKADDDTANPGAGKTVAPVEPTPTPVTERTEVPAERPIEPIAELPSSSEQPVAPVIDVTGEEVLRTKEGREVPVKELLGQETLLRRKDRKIAKLEPLVEQGKRVQQSPQLQALTQLVASGVPEAEAIRQMAQQLPPVAPVTDSDPKPQTREGFQPGDPEYHEDQTKMALWEQRQYFKSTITPVLEFVGKVNEVEHARQEQTAKERDTLDHNEKVLAEFTEYLPFDYVSLPDNVKKDLNARVVGAMAARGFSIKDNMTTHELNPLFVENAVRDAIEGFSPAPVATTERATEPIVPKPTPKQPLVPLPASMPTAPGPNTRPVRPKAFTFEESFANAAIKQ